MKSFNQYINEQYIDWNYVFGFILEQEDEPTFKVEEDVYGGETHTHTFKVPKKSGRGDHKVEVKIGRYGNDHHVSFEVDDYVEVGRAKRIPGQQRMRILRGVARAVTSYATKNVKPGHSIYAETADADPDDEDRKAGVQGEFFKGLARHLGRHLGTEAEYHNYDGISHEIRIPKKRKAAKVA